VTTAGEPLPTAVPFFEGVPLPDTAAWKAFAERFYREPGRPPAAERRGSDRPFDRCLEVARLAGARWVVIEHEYIDRDYLSEYSAFYAWAFDDYPSLCDRLHFFGGDLDPARLWQLPDDVDYLGYVVVRPMMLGVVGRTVLRPPPELEDSVRTAIDDPVTFCGQPLVAHGVPFMQQDARLGVCAHAAAWMCHYIAFRQGRDVARRSVAEFRAAVDTGQSPGRTLPSGGLGLEQIAGLLERFGLPPVHYEIDKLSDRDRPKDWLSAEPGVAERVRRVCCRYLNSELPVLVVAHVTIGAAPSADHALVVCGYRRARPGSHDVDLIAHDDIRGPYLVVRDPTADTDTGLRVPVPLREGGVELVPVSFHWIRLLAPLPQKVWLSAEVAERTGWTMLQGTSRQAGLDGDRAAGRVARMFASRARRRPLTVRTYAIEASRFKRELVDRFDDPRVIEHYRTLRMPRYIWVVEAIDRAARRRPDRRCVLGEIVIDSTSDDRDPAVLAVRLPGMLAMPKPGNLEWKTDATAEQVISGAPHHP
jgi:hypothetical protein